MLVWNNIKRHYLFYRTFMLRCFYNGWVVVLVVATVYMALACVPLVTCLTC